MLVVLTALRLAPHATAWISDAIRVTEAVHIRRMALDRAQSDRAPNGDSSAALARTLADLDDDIMQGPLPRVTEVFSRRVTDAAQNAGVELHTVTAIVPATSAKTSDTAVGLQLDATGDVYALGEWLLNLEGNKPRVRVGSLSAIEVGNNETSKLRISARIFVMHETLQTTERGR